MKAGIGVAVRRGARLPDISTVEAFKQTLLAAKSITYLKEGASTIYLDGLFARMGLADALRAKTVKPATESVSEAVAAGDVELGLIVIPNILSVPGAQLAGPAARGHPVLHRLHGGGCGEFTATSKRRAI